MEHIDTQHEGKISKINWFAILVSNIKYLCKRTTYICLYFTFCDTKIVFSLKEKKNTKCNGKRFAQQKKKKEENL